MQEELFRIKESYLEGKKYHPESYRKYYTIPPVTVPKNPPMPGRGARRNYLPPEHDFTNAPYTKGSIDFGSAQYLEKPYANSIPKAPRNYGVAGTLWRLFRHIEIPSEPLADQDRNAAIGMLFEERSLKNDALYILQLQQAKEICKTVFGVGDGIWKDWCYAGGLIRDPVFNKIMWYVAWMLEKSRLTQDRPSQTGLPNGVYEIVKDIRSWNDPGFKKLSDLLAVWSGKPPESHPDELAFDPDELEQNLRRLGLKHPIPHLDQPLAKPTRYRDPSSSDLGARGYPPRPGSSDPMEMISTEDLWT